MTLPGDEGTGDSARPTTVVEQLSLPPRASSAREARRWVVRQLEVWSLEPLCEQVELLTTEVVTNSLLHAGTPMLVEVVREGAGVRVSVTDGSSVVPTRRRYSPNASTGRGMTLLSGLADDYGWHTTPGGKVTWFRVERVRDAWGDVRFDDVMGGP
ncbi:ATP-binding protein [Aquipuribacter nitratireducens]|uniref:ATP-binding protein n=1 Tax=Aquipuribacter nitratireducens TaxID=650104 RepID=A0ABW0GL24_9MICO